MKIKELLDPKNGSRLGEILRFGIVGGVASLVQYGLYVVGVDVLNFSPVVATVISYVISMALNFVLSNYFTFNTRPSARRAAGFLTSHAVNLGLQTLLVAIFQGYVGRTLALLPALAICVPVNFLLVRTALKGLNSKH